MKHMLSELWHSLEMQGAGAGGLIDDWINKRKNKFVLPDVRGKICVVTGGGRGIGLEVVRYLLNSNATVIIGVRDPDSVDKIFESNKNKENIYVFKLDLTSLNSVKKFSDDVLNKFPKLNLLVNNAGVMFGEYKLTEYGCETQLSVNHLSHFYLTHLMLPALKRGGSEEELSRVVSVSSCAHHPGKIYWEDINMTKHYDENAAYAQSKLAQLMSARYVNHLLEEEGFPVKCYSVHPGIVNTDLFKNTVFKNYFNWAMDLMFKSPEQGATTILYASFEKSLDKKGGYYISNCQEGISNSISKNVDNQKRLFEVSCQLINIDSKHYGK